MAVYAECIRMSACNGSLSSHMADVYFGNQFRSTIYKEAILYANTYLYNIM